MQRTDADLAGAALAELAPRAVRRPGQLAGARVQPGPGTRRIHLAAHGHHGRHRRHAVPGRLARHGVHAERARGPSARAPGVLRWRATGAAGCSGLVPRRSARRARSSNPGSSIEIDREPDRDASRPIEKIIRSTLERHPRGDADWRRMRGKALEVAAEIGAATGARPEATRSARPRRCSSGWRTTTSRSSATASTACAAAAARTCSCRCPSPASASCGRAAGARAEADRADRRGARRSRAPPSC